MSGTLSQLDLLSWGEHYGVVLLRVVGLFIFLPIFGSSVLPMRFRLGIASVLALAFLPLVPHLETSPTDLAAWAIVGVRELSVGLGLGIAARMLFAGAETAAGLVAGQSGFALANMIDPTSGDQALAPVLFQNLLAISLFLAADLHHVLIRSFVASYELVPPALAMPDFGGLDRIVVAFGSRLFTIAAELAAPALIVTVALDLVMGLVGRAMPQVPILLVGYPVKMAVGLVAMAILATAAGSAMGWAGRTIASDGAAVLTALSGK